MLKQDLHEEDAVGKPRQRVDFAIAIGEPGARGPFTHDSSTKANHERQAVEKHMNTVTKKTQRPCHKSIGQLNKHKGKIKTG